MSSKEKDHSVQEPAPAPVAPEAVPAGPAPLREAPVRLTLTATRHGPAVLVTFRGTDCASVQAQVEQASVWLRAQTPAQPAAASTMCPTHGVPLQRNHGTHGKRWWSHQTDQGWGKGHARAPHLPTPSP